MGGHPEPDARAEFLQTESGSAGLLLAATLLALVWANSPLSGLYDDLWGMHLTVDLGGLEIDEDMRHWVNDGLMAFFFYLVGLEIRRELALGELRDRRAAAIPVLGALAGMVVPALLYVAVNAGGPGGGGWGIVMATDIAFVLGVVALLGDRCPPGRAGVPADPGDRGRHRRRHRDRRLLLQRRRPGGAGRRRRGAGPDRRGAAPDHVARAGLHGGRAGAVGAGAGGGHPPDHRRRGARAGHRGTPTAPGRHRPRGQPGPRLPARSVRRRGPRHRARGLAGRVAQRALPGRHPSVEQLRHRAAVRACQRRCTAGSRLGVPRA